ncbi:MAG: tetratricopeptide repeat protein [Kiritimatiellia bacterium]
MNITSRLVVLLVFLAGGFTAPASAALTDPAQIQTEAYVNLVQADQSLDAGRLDEALAQYQAARDYYLQLARDFPGWEPKIIQYRKTYCDNQILDVERRRTGGSPDELPELDSPPAAVAAAPEPAEEEAAPLPSQSVELDYLKSRVARLENELAALDAENSRLRGELKSAAQAQTELDALRADLARKDDRIQAFQKDLEAKKQLDQALNDMEAGANDLRAENERLKEELKNLDAELDDAEVRADQAELKVKQAEDKLKNAEQIAQKAEQEIQRAEKEAQKARDQKADAEAQLANAKKKADAGKSARAPEKAKTEAPAKPAEKKTETAKAESTAPVAASPVAATVPPRSVPKGMAAADFVRQLLQEGDNDAALATVQEARKARPTDMNLVLIESIALIRLQQYREAAAMLVDLAKNNPRNAEIHATLGAALMGAGFYEEARETLLMAVKFDKNLPECHYNLAQLYALVDPKDLKQARKHYKQALDLGIAPDAQLDKVLK